MDTIYTNENPGPWMVTATGRRFHPLFPRASDVDIQDIAHALSQVNRFGGHTCVPYSVAQHSLLCSLHAPAGFELEALLHDATEAYCGDMVRPLKNCMPAFEDAEHLIWIDAIAPKFGLPLEISPEVHAIDNILLVTEARQLMSGNHPWWLSPEFPAPLDILITHMSPLRAKRLFLNRFNELTRGLNP